MVDSALLCRKHLLGEHVECHMLLGSIKHNSPMLHPDAWLFEKYTDDDFMKIMEARVSVEKSIRDLCWRCPDCRARIEKAMGK